MRSFLADGPGKRDLQRPGELSAPSVARRTERGHDRIRCDALSLDLVTAALRADSADVAIYAQVLHPGESLSEALPPGTGSASTSSAPPSHCMRGRPGEVSGIVVRLGDQVMSLSVSRGQPAAEIRREVRGVVLSRTPVPLARVDGRVGQRPRCARRAQCGGGSGPANSPPAADEPLTSR